MQRVLLVHGTNEQDFRESIQVLVILGTSYPGCHGRARRGRRCGRCEGSLGGGALQDSSYLVLGFDRTGS